MDNRGYNPTYRGYDSIYNWSGPTLCRKRGDLYQAYNVWALSKWGLLMSYEGNTSDAKGLYSSWI